MPTPMRKQTEAAATLAEDHSHEYSRARWLPFLFFVLALGARFAGLRWGLPSPERWYSFHPDERQIVAAVLNLDFFAGDLNPNFFNYPSLFIYFAYIAHFLASGFGLTHTVTPANQMWAFSHDVILSARFVCALLGAATIPLVYLAAREVGSTRMAIVAATLMALLPGHVQHSHFATVDVPATFFVALSLWLAVRALRDADGLDNDSSEDSARWRRKSLMWSAFVAGLAAATKYNGIVAIMAPLTALWLLSRRENAPLARVLKTAAGLLGLSVAGFLISCPFSVLAFPEFWGEGVNGFAYELLRHPREGSGEVFQATGNGWWYHLTFNLPFVMTAPLLCMAILGMVLLALGCTTPNADAARHRVLAGPLLAFALIYFLALGSSQVRYMRYVLPLAPVLCFFAALAVEFTPRRMRLATTRAITVPAVVLSLITLAGTVDVLRPFTHTDPRDAAATWVRNNAAASTIALASDRPWFWSVPLSPQDAPPGSGITPEQALAQAAGGARYGLSLLALDSAKLAQEKPQYVVMSELEWRDKARLNDANYQKFRAHLDRDYDLQQEFTGAPSLLPGRAFVPHDFLYTNPQVRLYARKSGL
jgi:4-amino-4-deoxy-L-arabinose transferase-like glycosyltransferase